MNVDLTPAMDLPISKLPVLRTEAKKFKGFPRRLAGFDEWRISFSMAGREILATSHDGFKAGYK